MLAKSPAGNIHFALDPSSMSRASILGLCYLAECLRDATNNLFAPHHDGYYPDNRGVDVADPAVCTVGELCDLLVNLEVGVIEELANRPVPTSSKEREFRARVLIDHHFRFSMSEALEGDALLKLTAKL